MTDTLHVVKKAENDGYDAVVLGCFYDLGLQEAREISDKMVVTAPAESCMLLACSLGSTFSIIVGRKKWIPQMMGNVVHYGLKDRLASFKALDLGVLDFQEDKEKTEKRQIEASREAIEKDGVSDHTLGRRSNLASGKFSKKSSQVPS